MTYLIAKFTLLFLLTAVLAFMLGHWWSRRGFVDVSESFTALSQNKNADRPLWDRLWKTLEGFTPRDPDLSGVYQRLDAVAGAVADMPHPEPVSFSSVDKRLDSLSSKVAGIDVRPRDPDLGPVTSRLDALDKAVRSLPAVDISPLHERLARVEQAVNLEPLTQRIDSLESAVRAIPEPVAPEPVKLQPLAERMDSLEDAIRKMPRPVVPEPVKLQPLTERIDKLEHAVRAIPRPATPEPVKLQPLNERIEKLEQAVRAIPRPATPEPVKLQPLNERIEKLEQAVRAIPRPVAPEPVKLQPLAERLTKIETAVRNIPAPPKEAPPVRLDPVNARIDKLEAAVRAIPKPPQPADLSSVRGDIADLNKAVRGLPQPESVNLRPVNRRLDAIETQIKALDGRLSRVATRSTSTRTAPAKTSRKTADATRRTRTGPRLLSGAIHGKKDNLQRISGVGPMLEGLLNKNGVFYFWQISSWNRKDIALMDARLDAFKGRIERDDWVRQAGKLKREAGAAKEPAAV